MSKAWPRGSSGTWRTIRAQVLVRDEYRCQVRREGCTGEATQVHHTHGRLRTGDDPAFLVAACESCNRKVGDPMKSYDPPVERITRW